MSRMLKSSSAAAAATLLSRILGFVRELSYSWFMGVTAVADAFYAAFIIPNLFRRFLGEGALTAAFVPIFKTRERAGDIVGMWRATNAVLCGVVMICVAVTVLGIAGVTGLLWWSSPRQTAIAMQDLPVFSNRLKESAKGTGPFVQGRLSNSIPQALTNSRDPVSGELDLRHELMLRLLRVMFPYVILICATAVFIGVLNARGQFFLPALGAAMLNVVMIASVFVLASGWGQRWFGSSRQSQVFGLAIGVLVAGVAQGAFQLPALWREGYRPAWVTPWTDPTVREVARRMGPATIGVAAFQINVSISYWLAIDVGVSIASSFNTAVRLMELPQGVFGISLATYLLTELSGLAAEKKFPEFRATLEEGVRHVLFLNSLAAVLLLVLARPIIRLLFEYGYFDPLATPLAAAALQFLAPGLLAFSLNNILSRSFYALGDTGTPMKISVVCLVVNLLLVVILMTPLRQAGLGLANTLSAMLNTGLLIYALRRALPKLGLKALARNAALVVGVTALAGVAAVAVYRGLEPIFPVERFILPSHLAPGVPHRFSVIQVVFARAAVVFMPMMAAGAVYFGVASWLRLPQAGALWSLLRRRRCPLPVDI
ncbi:MAG: murein biosynthesis integral membrane protein MurJ [Pedosphaera sp.]|nr:murein biosynthesis integral membrane protein MurJ [Pedosphaera sp.]